MELNTYGHGGVPRSLGGWAGLEEMIADKGRVEVTLLVDRVQHIEGHADTNPPRKSDAESFGLIGDFSVFGFKRLVGRLISRDIPDRECAIVEVDSIAEYEEEDVPG